MAQNDVNKLLNLNFKSKAKQLRLDFNRNVEDYAEREQYDAVEALKAARQEQYDRNQNAWVSDAGLETVWGQLGNLPAETVAWGGRVAGHITSAPAKLNTYRNALSLTNEDKKAMETVQLFEDLGGVRNNIVESPEHGITEQSVKDAYNTVSGFQTRYFDNKLNKWVNAIPSEKEADAMSLLNKHEALGGKIGTQADMSAFGLSPEDIDKAYEHVDKPGGAEAYLMGGPMTGGITFDRQDRSQGKSVREIYEAMNESNAVGTMINEAFESQFQGINNPLAQGGALEDIKVGSQGFVDRWNEGLEIYEEDPFAAAGKMYEAAKEMVSGLGTALTENPYGVVAGLANNPDLLLPPVVKAVTAFGYGVDIASDSRNQFVEENGREPTQNELIGIMAMATTAGGADFFADTLLGKAFKGVKAAKKVKKGDKGTTDKPDATATPAKPDAEADLSFGDKVAKGARELAGVTEKSGAGKAINMATAVSEGVARVAAGTVKSGARVSKAAVTEFGTESYQALVEKKLGALNTDITDEDYVEAFTEGGLGALIGGSMGAMGELRPLQQKIKDAYVKARDVNNEEKKLEKKVTKAVTSGNFDDLVDKPAQHAEALFRTASADNDVTLAEENFNKANDLFKQRIQDARDVGDQIDAIIAAKGDNAPELADLYTKTAEIDNDLQVMAEARKASSDALAIKKKAAATNDTQLYGSFAMSNGVLSLEEAETLAQSDELTDIQKTQVENYANTRRTLQNMDEVSSQIITGGVDKSTKKRFVGTLEYAQQVNDAVNDGDTEAAKKAYTQLRNFRIRHEAKLEMAKEAVAGGINSDAVYAYEKQFNAKVNKPKQLAALAKQVNYMQREVDAITETSRGAHNLLTKAIGDQAPTDVFTTGDQNGQTDPNATTGQGDQSTDPTVTVTQGTTPSGNTDPNSTTTKPTPPKVALPKRNAVSKTIHAKDQTKSDQATKFIGFGRKGSSTAGYRTAWEQQGLANTGTYTSDDTVFVSVNGRSGPTKADAAATQKELKAAIQAGATIITDNKENRDRTHSVKGEGRVAKYLEAQGYVETDGNGVWTKASTQPQQQQQQQPVVTQGQQQSTTPIATTDTVVEGIKQAYGARMTSLTGSDAVARKQAIDATPLGIMAKEVLTIAEGTAYDIAEALTRNNVTIEQLIEGVNDSPMVGAGKAMLVNKLQTAATEITQAQQQQQQQPAGNVVTQDGSQDDNQEEEVVEKEARNKLYSTIQGPPKPYRTLTEEEAAEIDGELTYSRPLLKDIPPSVSKPIVAILRKVLNRADAALSKRMSSLLGVRLTAAKKRGDEISLRAIHANRKHIASLQAELLDSPIARVINDKNAGKNLAAVMQANNVTMEDLIDFLLKNGATVEEVGPFYEALEKFGEAQANPEGKSTPTTKPELNKDATVQGPLEYANLPSAILNSFIAQLNEAATALIQLSMGNRWEVTREQMEANVGKYTKSLEEYIAKDSKAKTELADTKEKIKQYREYLVSGDITVLPVDMQESASRSDVAEKANKLLARQEQLMRDSSYGKALRDLTNLKLYRDRNESDPDVKPARKGEARISEAAAKRELERQKNKAQKRVQYLRDVLEGKKEPEVINVIDLITNDDTKPLDQQNLVKKWFKGSRTGNLLSRVMNFTNLLIPGTAEFEEHMDPEDGTQAKVFLELIGKVSKKLDKAFLYKRGVTKNGVDRAVFRKNDFVQFLADPSTGKLLPQVKVAIAAAIYEWVASSAKGSLYNEDSSINGILGNPKEDPVSFMARNELSRAGVIKHSLAESLGNTAIGALQLSGNDQVPEYAKAVLANALGSYAIALMDDMGIIEQVQIPVTELAELSENFKVANADLTSEDATVDFFRAKTVDNDGKTLREAGRRLKDSNLRNGFLDTLFGVERKSPMPSFEKPKGVVALMKNTFQNVPARVRSIIEKHQNRPWRLKTQELAVFNFLGRDGQRAINSYNFNTETTIEDMELLNQLGELGKDTEIPMDLAIMKAGIEGHNNAIDLELDALVEFTENTDLATDPNKEFYFTHEIWKNLRIGIKNIINPQTSKIHRHLVSAVGWEQEVRLDDNALMEQFKLAVAEGLDLDVDKHNIADSLARFEAKIADPDIQAGIAAIQQILNDTVDPDQIPELQEAIIKAVAKGKAKTHTLDALTNYAKYKNALEDASKESFVANIFREVDGITNGIAIAALMFAGGQMLADQFAALNAMGMFFDHQNPSYGDWRKEGNMDTYEQIVPLWQAAIRKVLSFSDFKKMKGPKITALKTKIRNLQLIANTVGNPEVLLDTAVESLGVSGAERGSVKYRLMEIIYGAGAKSVKNTVGYAFVETMYDRLNKGLKTRNMKLVRETIETMNAILAPLEGEHEGTSAALIIQVPKNMAELHQFELTKMQTNALVDAVANSYGVTLTDAIQKKYAHFIQTRVLVNTAALVANLAFRDAYATEVDKAIQKKKDAGEWVEGISDLSVKEYEAIRDSLKETMPILHNFFSAESGNLDEGLFVGGYDKERQYDNKLGVYKQEIQLNNRLGNTSNISSYASKRVFTDSGVAPAILMIHALDAATMLLKYATGNIMGIHDAIGIALSQVLEEAIGMNGNFLEVMNGFSVMGQANALLQRVSEMDTEIRNSAPDGLYVRTFLDEQYETVAEYNRWKYPNYTPNEFDSRTMRTPIYTTIKKFLEPDKIEPTFHGQFKQLMEITGYSTTGVDNSKQELLGRMTAMSQYHVEGGAFDMSATYTGNTTPEENKPATSVTGETLSKSGQELLNAAQQTATAVLATSSNAPRTEGELQVTLLEAVNMYDIKQLMGLKGIGPARAKAIMAARANGDIQSLEDLVKLKIPKKIVDALAAEMGVASPAQAVTEEVLDSTTTEKLSTKLEGRALLDSLGVAVALVSQMETVEDTFFIDTVLKAEKVLESIQAIHDAYTRTLEPRALRKDGSIDNMQLAVGYEEEQAAVQLQEMLDAAKQALKEAQALAQESSYDLFADGFNSPLEDAEQAVVAHQRAYDEFVATLDPNWKWKDNQLATWLPETQRATGKVLTANLRKARAELKKVKADIAAQEAAASKAETEAKAKEEVKAKVDTLFEAVVAQENESTVTSSLEPEVTASKPKALTEVDNNQDEDGDGYTGEDWSIGRFSKPELTGDIRTDYTYDPALRVSQQNSLDVYDQLEANSVVKDSDEHSSYLRSLFTDVYNKVLQPFNLYLASSGATDTIGATSLSDMYIVNQTITAGAVVSGLLGNGIRMSANEVYAHEVTHNIITKALASSPALRREMRKLWKQVKDALGKDGYKAFMNPNTKETDLHYEDEVKLAKQRYDYIFNLRKLDGSPNENYLDEFAAFGLTNAFFKSKLGTISVKRVSNLNDNPTIMERINDMFQRMLDFFFKQLTGATKSTADAQLYQLMTALAQVDQRAKGPLIQAAKAGTNFAGKQVNAVQSVAAKALVKIGDMDIVKGSKWAVVRAAGGLMTIIGEDNVSYFMDTLKKFATVNSDTNNSFADVTSKILVEGSGRTKQNGVFHDLKRIGNHVIDQTRKRTMQITKRSINKAFNRELTSAEKRTVTLALQADLAPVINTIGREETVELLKDRTKLRSKINELEKQIKEEFPKAGMFYNNHSKNLGHWLITGKSLLPEGVLKNAHNIASLYLTSKKRPSKAEIAKATPMIDLLASYHAMDRLHKGSSATDLASLMKSQPSGMNFVIGMYEGFKENSKEELDRAHITKGYIADLNNPEITVAFGTKDEVAEYTAQGFAVSGKLEKDPTDTMDETVFIFTAKDGGNARYNAGIVNLLSPKARGTNQYNVAINAGYEREGLGKGTHSAMVAVSKDKRKLADNSFGQVSFREGSYTSAVFDPEGNVTSWNYLMSSHAKDAYLERDTAIDNVLSKMVADLGIKPKVRESNRKFVKALKAQYDLDFKENPKEYVTISPLSDNKRYRDIWNMLPPDMKAAVQKEFGAEGLKVKHDMLDLGFGYRKYSLTEILDKDPEERNYFEKVMGLMIETMFGKKARRRVRNTGNIVAELVAMGKDAWVIKSFVVTAANTMSNLLLLKMRGVSIKETFYSYAVATKGLADYKKQILELGELEQQLAYKKMSNHRRNKTADRVAELKIELDKNPVKALLDAGVLQTIVEDVDTDAAESKVRSYVAEKMDKYTSRVPQGLKNAAATATLMQGTKGYNFLRDLAQMSDFGARFALYNHQTKSGKMTHDEAIGHVMDIFIDYDLPTHRMIQYGNDLGFLFFTKYLVRVIRIMYITARDYPGRVLALLLLQNYFGDVTDIYDSGLNPFSKLGTPLSFIDAGGDVATVAAASSLL